jgi:hypothetical protein
LAVGYYFNPKGMTTERYDETLRRLEAAGAGSPPGRQYHVAFGEEGGLSVFDVWDSTESFDKFGETLLPILQELAIDVGEPSVVPVHNIIVG